MLTLRSIEMWLKPYLTVEAQPNHPKTMIWIGYHHRPSDSGFTLRPVITYNGGYLTWNEYSEPVIPMDIP